MDKAIDAAWAELECQFEHGKPGPYVDREISVIDGQVDMPALVRAILASQERAI